MPLGAHERVDLIDQDIWEAGAPYETFRRLRAEAPVYWHDEPDGPGFWALTRHADVQRVSKDPSTFSSARGGVSRLDPSTQEELELYRNVIIAMDPPLHRSIRGILSSIFTPRNIGNLEPAIRQIAKRAVDAALEKRTIDFVEDFAAPIPMHAISEMMGVPEDKRQRLYELSNGMIDDQDPEVAPTDDFRATAQVEVFATAQELAAQQGGTADTLTTKLLAAEFEGRKINELEYNMFFTFLVIAGNETTRTSASGGLKTLLDHPDHLREAQADPTLLPNAIEEMVRYWPPIHHFRRSATKDVELRGQRIREGDKVLMWYPAANRDEDVFDEPDRFDIHRSPNEHLSFGIGEHFCMGASLARMELRVMFEELLSRVKEIVPLAPPRRLRSNLINGIKEMRVELRPR